MKRKAQSSFEFSTLLAVMFLVTSAFIVVLGEREQQFKAQLQEQEVALITMLVQQEATFAWRVPDGFERTFTLPPQVFGQSYIITVVQGTELLLITPDTQYVNFLPFTILVDDGTGPQPNGVLQPGNVKVRRVNGNIVLSQRFP